MDIFVILDAAENVVGAIYPASQSTVEGEQAREVIKEAELVPVPQAGQRVYRVEIPSELSEITPPDALYDALIPYRVELAGGPARLVRRT
jgi:hypothetical protein